MAADVEVGRAIREESTLSKSVLEEHALPHTGGFFSQFLLLWGAEIIGAQPPRLPALGCLVGGVETL
eukprot:1261701-Rhodomonas_salina.1